MNENRSTHWTFRHDQVLNGVPPVLLNWFIYALQRVRPDEIDPLEGMTIELHPWRIVIMGWQRNMWCTGPILHAAGRTIYRVGDDWVAAAQPPKDGEAVEVFRFVRARVEISDKARTQWALAASEPNMFMYRVSDSKNHAEALRNVLHDLLVHFPSVVEVERAN
jgi:hypothetical protein